MTLPLDKRLSRIKDRYSTYYCDLMRKHPYLKHQREVLLWEIEGLMNSGESLKDEPRVVYRKVNSFIRKAKRELRNKSSET